MKTKKEIVDNWLPRYTGTAVEDFGDYILVTNFGNYVEIFAQRNGTEIMGRDRPMPNATADGITRDCDNLRHGFRQSNSDRGADARQ